jgi:hypothetical protein
VIAYGMNEDSLTKAIPLRLEKLFRRLAMLERGHTYVLSLRLPEREGEAVELTVLASGRIEAMSCETGVSAK